MRETRGLLGAVNGAMLAHNTCIRSSLEYIPGLTVKRALTGALVANECVTTHSLTHPGRTRRVEQREISRRIKSQKQKKKGKGESHEKDTDGRRDRRGGCIHRGCERPVRVRELQCRRPYRDADL